MDDDTRKTIVMVGVFGSTGVIVMLLRLGARRYRKQDFNLSDYLTMAAIVCLAARSAFTTLVVLWGNNNNLSAAYLASTNPFSDAEVYQRGVGSKVTLVNRIVYNTYIWIQKSVVLLLYRRMFNGLPRPYHVIRFYWVFLGATYVAVQIVTFVECRPFSRYWQVVPDPGKCPQAPIQLITFVALNIATDMGLIIIPMPWLFGMKRSLKQRLSLIALFSIGLLLIAIAIARLPIYPNGTSQVNRNTWGSVEAFAAALVANVPTLFALRHSAQPKDPAAMTQTRRSSDYVVAAGFRYVKPAGIIVVTSSVEQRNDAVQDVRVSPEPRDFWTRHASRDHLVPYVHVSGSPS